MGFARFLMIGFARFLVGSLSVDGVRSLELVHYIVWGSDVVSSPNTLHITRIIVSTCAFSLRFNRF
jgi:hypothetical protein